MENTPLEARVEALERVVDLLRDELSDSWEEMVNHEERDNAIGARLDAAAEGGEAARDALRKVVNFNTSLIGGTQDMIGIITLLLADVYERLDVNADVLAATVRTARGEGDQKPESVVDDLLSTVTGGRGTSGG